MNPRFVGSLLCWVLVWLFWLVLTHRFHPSFLLALITTTSLVVAYAAAAYCNQLILVPRFWQFGARWKYVVSLVMVMSLLTGVALFVIRTSYVFAFGPDADPYGFIKHYLIDLFGMVFHVAVAALLAWAVRVFGWTRLCNWFLFVALSVCLILTITILGLQPNLELLVKKNLPGRNMPDAFNHLNKALPVFLFVLTLSIAVLRLIFLNRQYELATLLFAGPVMCITALIFTEDFEDPNWSTMLAVVSIGMLVSCFVTYGMYCIKKSKNKSTK